MNINLVAVPFSNSAKLELKTRFDAAVAYGQDIFGESNGHTVFGEGFAIYNADRLGGTWTVPTWYEGEEIIALSQPPIPVRESVTTESYDSVLFDIVRNQKFQEFLPNHFGILCNQDGSIIVWNDATGMGRCYYVLNNEYFAACNHIGTLAFFLTGQLEIDDAALGKFAGAGYFMDDDSPFTDIKRLDAGTLIEVSANGQVEKREYFDVAELVSPAGTRPDYAYVAEEMQTIAKNLDTLSTRTATVYLSGGRDSRMTAGLWLSGGSDARVLTLGTLEREAEIASELIARFTPRTGQSVEHVIQVAKGSDITQPLCERVDLAFKMWDGDAAPTNIKRNLAVPTGRAALSIGGVGGEIMHGYYYSRPGLLEKVSESADPYSFALSSFGVRYLTEQSAQEIRTSFAKVYEKSKSLNLDNFSALDFLYMNQKLRRWGNQALTSTSAIMLSSPAFVRGCFDLEPSEKVAKDFPVRLVDQAIPEWSGVEYYKANPDDSKKLMKRGLATFQSDPEGFADLITRGRNWTKYLASERIDSFLEAAQRDEATYPQESWLNRVIWLEAIVAHAAELNAQVRTALRGLKSISTSKTGSLNNSFTAAGGKDNFSKVDKQYLVGILRTWPFQPLGTDNVYADLLYDNKARLGKETIPINSRTLSPGDEDQSPHFLALQSMRWIDPLLRTDVGEQKYQDKWILLFKDWWKLASAVPLEHRIWNPSITIQRSTALSLGGEAINALPDDLISAHVTGLRSCLAQNLDAGLRKKAISALLMIYQAHNPSQLSDPGLWRQICESLSGVIRDGGGVYAPHCRAMIEDKQDWRDFLTAIDPSGAFVSEFHERLEQLEFWVQAHQPDGALVPFGSEPEPAEILDSYPQLRYIRSHATKGQPPTKVRFVDPGGLVTGRTGWGETERDLTEESFWSILSGPVRSRQEHQDIGRLTFSSQGVNWLVDPCHGDLSGSEYHSVITVKGRRFRTNAFADLVVQRETDTVDDYVFRINTFLPVAWRRHVTFVRTANYLVVEDHLSASKEFDAAISWMINPDAEVVISGTSTFISMGGRTVELQTSSGQLGDLQIDDVYTAEGTRLAKRLSASIKGRTARVITVISDVVDQEQHLVKRIALKGNEFAFNIRDKRLEETIVVTQSGAGIIPNGMDAEDGVQQVLQEIASGTLSDEEVAEQRIRVHESIRETKKRVWLENGSVEARKEAIQELIKVAETQHVEGIRDHGLAAALIDLAGADLKTLIKDISLTHNFRRSALIDWAGGNGLQEFYQVPIYTTLDAKKLPEFKENKQIWSIDSGEVVGASYNIDAPGDTLVVYFHGATDRTRHSTPRFERLRSFSGIGKGPLMFFSDSTLDFDARMILSWFIGTGTTDLHKLIAEMIAKYALEKSVKHVVLVGNSGGGFTALQVSSYLDGVEVLSVNGQVDLGRYQSRIVDPAHRAVYGVPVDMEQVSLDPRMNVIQRFKERGFTNRVFMYQNTGDDHHMTDHYQPFEDAFQHEELFNVEKVFLGNGHVPPAREDYVMLIRKIVEKAQNGGAIFKGLAN